MKRKRLHVLAPAALALAMTSAWAGQITLYERPDFNGPYFAVNDRIETVARQGTFEDTASSIVVRDGRWEVCTEAYFRGRCTELLPGSYPQMSVSLNGRIASARQVGYADPLPVTISPPVSMGSQPPVVVNLPQIVVNPPASAATTQPYIVNPPPIVLNPPSAAVQPAVVTTPSIVTTLPAPTGRVYLYEDPNFGGAWVAMDRGLANDMDWANFSNPAHRATSVRVESGNWLFCTDMAFRGDCRVLGPGEYPQLSGPLTAGISSARQVFYPEVRLDIGVSPLARARRTHTAFESGRESDLTTGPLPPCCVKPSGCGS